MADDFRALTDMMAQHARERPDAIALRWEGRTRTWGELDARMNRVARGLHRLGLGRGDKVALVTRNSFAAIELFFGAVRAGCCAVPLSGMSTPETLRLMIEDSDSRVLGVGSESRELVEGVLSDLPQLADGCVFGLDFDGGAFRPFEALLEGVDASDPGVEIKPGDDFNIIYSSGTTGVPKGILHSQAMRYGMVARADLWRFGPDAVNLTSTPIYSNTTMAALLPALASGATTVLMTKFDEQRFLELSAEYGATHAMLVPVQYQRLLAHERFDRHDLSSYRLKLCTSAPLRAETKRDILDRWPGDLIEIYGLTEGGAVCLLNARKHPGKLHTVGRPSRMSDVRIIDGEGRELPVGSIGEVVGRQRVMMTGYYKKPDATAAIMWESPAGERFQKTGDMGRFDEDGFLQLLDRKKDVIISGGFNVYAVDLEAALSRHPAVKDVAVIGIPSERWGETPLGLVVVGEGTDVEAAAIAEWANAQLGKNQRLTGVEIRESLPRNAIGKVLKRELRDPYWPDQPGSGA
ncbi:MAG: class I adenylate-forming enzyme family protein [Myxococcales bacterium]|nr:class I adenylate-forming enzyme family protein [Myxococcales bacterium]